MSCPTNCVCASWPWTWLTRKASLMCILLKSPVRSCTVTSVTRPTSLSGVSVGVSPSTCLLNISGARRLYHTFAFHLSLILRAAARDFCSAMEAVRKGGVYLRVRGKPFESTPSRYLAKRGTRSPRGPSFHLASALKSCPRIRLVGGSRVGTRVIVFVSILTAVALVTSVQAAPQAGDSRWAFTQEGASEATLPA